MSTAVWARKKSQNHYLPYPNRFCPIEGGPLRVTLFQNQSLLKTGDKPCQAKSCFFNLLES